MDYKLLICSKCKTEFVFSVRDLWRIPVCPRCGGGLVKPDSNINDDGTSSI